MVIFISIVWLLVGFVALIKGADFFVDGSASVARTLKVPGVIIGLTIVAMGTSAPELAVSVSAALSGSNAIAVSNVVGSNIFNLLMVLGICALMKPLPVDRGIQKRDYPISLGATVLVVLLAGDLILSGRSRNLRDGMAPAGMLFRWNGLVLLVVFIAYLALTIYIAKKSRTEEDEEEPLPMWQSILYILGGLVAIVIGGRLVVDNARILALTLGMSETLVGLTIVAIGTSLPELVTSVVASLKGQNGMAVGNVVGSNIFNLLLILGTSSFVHPIQISVHSFVDLGLLLGVSLVAYGLIATGREISRIEGGVLVAMYAAYTAYAIIR